MNKIIFIFLLSIPFMACKPDTSKRNANGEENLVREVSLKEPASDIKPKAVSLVQEEAPNSLDAASVEAEKPQTANGKENKLATSAMYRFAYDFKKETAEFKLPKKLVEISGLSMSSDGRFLLAVNDEQGKIFFINKSTGEIVREVKFGKSGDYEGVEMVQDKIYALKSNGTIYELESFEEEEVSAKSYNTPLNTDNNLEGLAYDKSRHRLLLACKKYAGEEEILEKNKYIRSVYAFDLKTKQLLKEPVYRVNRKKTLIAKNVKAASWWQEELADSFAPSGMAVHPKSGNIYLLSSPGKLLLVLNPAGEAIHLERLDKKQFRQPEGICFEKNGVLFISSEGNAKKGVNGEILRFNQL